MKLIRFIFIIIVILAIIAFAAQFVVKNLASDKISDSLRTILEESTDNKASFEDFEIDLFNSQIDISDFRFPIPDSDGLSEFGILTVGSTEIDFALTDATSFISDNGTISEGTITMKDSLLTTNTLLQVEAAVETIVIDFKGSIDIETLNTDGSQAIGDLLHANQEINIMLENLVLDIPADDKLPAILDTLKTRTTPVTGFEIAMLSSIILPDIPIRNTIIQEIATSGVSIEPEQFASVLSLGTQLLGIDSDANMMSDANLKVISAELEDKVKISGNMENAIGTFTIEGTGSIHEINTDLSEIEELTISIANLNSDLQEILGKDELIITLDNPIMLENLIEGMYSFQ